MTRRNLKEAGQSGLPAPYAVMQTKPKPCRYCLSAFHQSFQCGFKPPKGSKPCKWCDSEKHLSWQCFKNPNRLKQTKTKIKNGKQFWLGIQTRKAWYKENPADYYTCYLCGKSLLKQDVTLDHIKPRSGHPSLRHELSNLAPCCWECNNKKGSQSLDNYKKSIDI